jgi:hypothetical protein
VTARPKAENASDFKGFCYNEKTAGVLGIPDSPGGDVVVNLVVSLLSLPTADNRKQSKKDEN